ncbi:hypothetical protein CC86DRAFT_375771 [Ophiobolus disseminans]|uniref:Uncharacterized protein n=1 Tax=Ophiobolus disseminans TaxID=1469910 RepID=A0A6A6ZC45_9PLEO|nr:hypothetical protein CC86DRAFT_375771 [Ophiobolus disseminans]
MSDPYTKALAAIDAAHALDPTKTTTTTNEEIPYELHYAQKCTSYLEQRSPNSPDHLRLAIRAQHFRRWEVPRASYPMTRPGYHAWRTYLKKRQAELVQEICLQSGYDEEFAQRVGSLIRKEDLKKDEETQILEVPEDSTTSPVSLSTMTPRFFPRPVGRSLRERSPNAGPPENAPEHVDNVLR